MITLSNSRLLACLVLLLGAGGWLVTGCAPRPGGADTASPVGVWQGALQVTGAPSTGGVPPATLRLELTANDNPDATYNVVGSAELCDPAVTEQFDVYANVDRRGQLSDLTLRPLGAAPVWLLNQLSATWSGPTLTVAGDVNYAADGRHIIRSDVPQPTFQLTLSRPAAAVTTCRE